MNVDCTIFCIADPTYNRRLYTDLTLVDDSSAIASWLNRHIWNFDSFIWKAKYSTGAVNVEQQLVAIVWAICNKHDRFNYHTVSDSIKSYSLLRRILSLMTGDSTPPGKYTSGSNGSSRSDTWLRQSCSETKMNYKQCVSCSDTTSSVFLAVTLKWTTSSVFLCITYCGRSSTILAQVHCDNAAAVLVGSLCAPSTTPTGSLWHWPAACDCSQRKWNNRTPEQAGSRSTGRRKYSKIF